MSDDDRCLVCNRDMTNAEVRSYPSGNGCSAELRALREKFPNRPLCPDCVPEIFKRPFLNGAMPIRSAADLPKIGEPLPAHVAVASYPIAQAAIAGLAACEADLEEAGLVDADATRRLYERLRKLEKP